MGTADVVWPDVKGWPKVWPKDVGMSSEQLANVPDLVGFVYKRGVVIIFKSC